MKPVILQPGPQVWLSSSVLSAYQGGSYSNVRIHDLRHTFICRRLERWQAEGCDIDNAIAALSTYVGHAKVSDTYWYMTGIPDLMAIAGSRFEGFASGEDVHV